MIREKLNTPNTPLFLMMVSIVVSFVVLFFYFLTAMEDIESNYKESMAIATEREQARNELLKKYYSLASDQNKRILKLESRLKDCKKILSKIEN